MARRLNRPPDAAWQPAGQAGDARQAAARPKASRPGLSLKGRALRLLSRREHSRFELRRKLAPHAGSEAELDAVLDALEQARLLSDARFAESLVYRKAERYGAAVLRHELRSHQLDASIVAGQLSALQQSEFSRAQALWARRFGAPPDSPQARLRQLRFLMARGFPADVVRKVVGRTASTDPDASDPWPDD